MPGARDVLVLGLGNTLLGDDGVGVHVIRHIEGDPDTPLGLWPLDGGTLGFRLMDAFARANAVVLVDAAELNAPAGSIRLMTAEALDRHVRRIGRTSAHEAGLIDLLTLAKLEQRVPSRLALVGIQPQRINWDDSLSPAVDRAVPLAARLVIETVRQWQAAA